MLSWSAYFQSILYIWLVWKTERILLPNLSHSTLYLVVIVVNYNILFTLIDVVVVAQLAKSSIKVFSCTWKGGGVLEPMTRVVIR